MHGLLVEDGFEETSIHPIMMGDLVSRFSAFLVPVTTVDERVMRYHHDWSQV